MGKKLENNGLPSEPWVTRERPDGGGSPSALIERKALLVALDEPVERAGELVERPVVEDLIATFRNECGRHRCCRSHELFVCRHW